jgi:hypothetical protein
VKSSICSKYRCSQWGEAQNKEEEHVEKKVSTAMTPMHYGLVEEEETMTVKKRINKERV